MYPNDEIKFSYYKARYGKIHKYDPNTKKFVCGRKQNWNYSPMYIKPQINEGNIQHYCKRCFAQENRVNQVLTTGLPDELFEI